MHLLAEATGVTHYEDWYAGRQVLITANDRGLGISNGDIGVAVRAEEGRLRVVVRIAGELRLFAPTRLSGVETVFAMTVHKSQGSEARAVTVVLPPEESPLLTRELFYTARHPGPGARHHRRHRGAAARRCRPPGAARLRARGPAATSAP